ncbi:unnamed protein product [Meganyctiphanes norvegica]|uniref:VLIG-type G domain-containing protein n=1 Tax=Meganyctiphanes norvegica TaxID=48144 RepID=A0AAV2QU13_MEGNR
MLMATRDMPNRTPTEDPLVTSYEKNGHNNRASYTGILKDLKLEELASLRFGIKDILSVSRSSLYNEELKTLKDKILFVISKIAIGDCSHLTMLLCTETNYGDVEKVIENYKDDDDNLFSMIPNNNEESQDIRNRLHQSDVIIIIMNCCDNILKQLLIKKIVMCQVAIPLSFPNLFNNEQMFNLWALRLLNLEWTTKSTGVRKENPVDYPIPIVSAIRLGDLSKSKSSILNGIMCIQAHNIFFHKDCDGGHLSRKLSNGVLEMAWYLPGNCKDESFDDIFTIANLRGDALKYSLQIDLLNKISTVMLIFLTKESLCHSFDIIEKCSTSCQPLIFIFLDAVSPVIDKNKKQNEKENFEKLVKIMNNKEFIYVRESVNGKQKNVAALNIEIKNKIKQSLIGIKTRNNNNILTLKVVSDVAKDIGINIDESTEHCRRGKELADYVISILDSNNIEDRNLILPLQGKILSNWSRLLKQHARREGAEGVNPEDFDLNIYHEKKKCREHQFRLVQNMVTEMEKLPLFTKQNKGVISYFLMWMKINLDAKSKKLLPKLQSNYNELLNNIQKKMVKEDNDFVKLTNLEKRIRNSSLGLEHFMREVGQVFEASVHHKKIKEFENLLNNLPICAANLLIAGFPLEIMDGDACQMPTAWLKAIFDALSQQLDNKKIFIISVLGIQSSGKSTLLNTMFGFNFAVGSGRCTKGVFAQLITVDEHLAQELGFEYILVLDTEGLRAPELRNRTHGHDNEIATLVIAMGDVTIVNLMGESTSEIEEILQISVHAFLRMRIASNNTKLKPGCYFVHQNVSGVTASNNMQFSYGKLTEHLDSITAAAAELEEINEIQKFNDVIEFDMNQQIWYFPGLWIGNPPMAPINPRYSEKAFDFKTNILNYPSKKEIKCLTFSEIKDRLSYLWGAILKENFVFSFRNSLELQCFNHLENKVLSLCMEFRKNVSQEKHNFCNKIDNCEDTDLTAYKVTVQIEFETFIENYHESCKKDLKEFIENTRDKNIMSQWELSVLNKVQFVNNELNNEAVLDFTNRFELRKIEYDQREKVSEYMEEVKAFVGEIAIIDFDSENDEESPEVKFENKWMIFIDKLRFTKIKKRTNISAEVWRVFQKVYYQYHTIYNQYNQSEKFDTCDLDIIPIISDVDFTKKSAKYEDVHELRNAITEMKSYTFVIMSKIKEYLYSIKSLDFDNNFTWNIHEIFQKMIRNFNEQNQKYNLSIRYQVKVFAHILKNVIPHFQKMHKDHLDKVNPKNTLIEKYKPQVYKVFIGTYNKCQKEIMAANILKDILLPSILDSMKDCLSENITFILMSSNKEFQTKPELTKKVLMDLRKENIFDKYIMYIEHPNKAFKIWIEKYVYDYCMEVDVNGKSMLGKKANEIFKNKLTELIGCVQQTLEHLESNAHQLKKCSQQISSNSETKITKLIECVPQASENSDLTFQDWINKFKDAAKEIIPLSNTLHNIFDMKAVEVKDINFFGKEFIKGLESLITSQEKILDNWELTELNNVNKQPHMLICDSILGCMKQCPFCKVFCSCTIEHPGKEHTAPRHYPKGLKGIYWDTNKELSLESCNVDVASDRTFQNEATGQRWHKYKEYKSVNDSYASWNIAADTSLEASLYWKWVFAQFSENFVEYYSKIYLEKYGYKVKCTKIPSEWKNIKEEDVDESLNIMFQ